MKVTVTQASAVVSECLHSGISIIDHEFGPGYAMKNPAFLATIVNSLVHEHSQPMRHEASCAIAKAIEKLAE